MKIHCIELAFKCRALSVTVWSKMLEEALTLRNNFLRSMERQFLAYDFCEGEISG